MSMKKKLLKLDPVELSAQVHCEVSKRKKVTLATPATPKRSSVMPGLHQPEQLQKETGEQEKIPVSLPTQIVKNGLCYITETTGIYLPVSTPIDVNILYVDQASAFYVKLAGDNTLQKESFGNTLFNIEEFYIYPENRRKTRMGVKDWKPVVNEVVIVSIVRKTPVKNSYRGFIPKRQLQRAQVLKLYRNGAKVQLLDDYGIGGVVEDAIFQIMPSMTLSKAQTFAVELCEFDIFNGFDWVQRVIQNRPLPGITGDLSEYKFSMTFTGHYGQQGRPRVEFKFLCDNSLVDLRTHLLQNIGEMLSPMPYLRGTGCPCVVVRFDSFGFFWIRLLQHKKLLQEIVRRLEEIKPNFIDALRNCPLYLDNILAKEHAESNLNAVYIALLSSDSEAIKLTNIIRRVKIKSYSPGNNVICVSCIDYGTDHYVNTYDILPASAFQDVLSYIPPLLHKVHLNTIKKLNGNDEIVQNLFRAVIEVCLVEEVNGHPPEMRFYFPNDASQLGSVSSLKSDIARYLIERNYATAFSSESGMELEAFRKKFQNRDCMKQVAQVDTETPIETCSFSSFQFVWEEGQREDI